MILLDQPGRNSKSHNRAWTHTSDGTESDSKRCVDMDLPQGPAGWMLEPFVKANHQTEFRNRTLRGRRPESSSKTGWPEALLVAHGRQPQPTVLPESAQRPLARRKYFP